MEEEQARQEMPEGLRIEIVKNSIRFDTPDGQKFYKNLSNFMGVLEKALQNGKRSTYTLAPIRVA